MTTKTDLITLVTEMDLCHKNKHQFNAAISRTYDAINAIPGKDSAPLMAEGSSEISTPVESPNDPSLENVLNLVRSIRTRTYAREGSKASMDNALASIDLLTHSLENALTCLQKKAETNKGVPADSSYSGSAEFADELSEVLAEVQRVLLMKNAAYGDSALSPIRVMSKADPEAGIRIRIDDKLSRLMRGSAAGEDTELDLLGYLIMLRIAQKRNLS